MSLPEQYDFIIAGAGASGLSLFWQIISSDRLKESKILLIDKSLKPSNDKTWCFWDDHSVAFKDLIYHTWDFLEVSADQKTYTEELSRYKYHCMRSLDYSTTILELAKTQANLTLLEAEISHFTHTGDFAEIHTSKGTFKAFWIFQSALKPPDLEQSKLDISLMQHFMGWEIETDGKLFDPKKAILMDFDVPQQNGVTFLYVLPFSENKALIEYTLFSSQLLTDEEYETGIRFYLKDKFGLKSGDYKINRKEKGVIPMEDRRYPAWYCNRVLNMGTMGGLTKPSTGYTFTRIHRHTKEIVKALEAGKKPPVSKASTYRFRVYDMMLLYLLDEHPDTSVTIFSELFKGNSFDRILQFLEEKTHPGQEIKIFSSLPYMPFFKSIWKMKHRIFSGA
jgi:lycopene beta-cyclase